MGVKGCFCGGLGGIAELGRVALKRNFGFGNCGRGGMLKRLGGQFSAYHGDTETDRI